MKFCSEPGCTGVARAGSFCDRHKSDNYRTRREAESAEPWQGWYRLRYWRRGSKMFLRSDGGAHAICEATDRETGERCTRIATEVDHKVPHRGDWNLFADWKNWQGLCHKHHSAKTAKETNFGKGD
jgi:5-methylcytosine-specific restriction protein A